MRLIHGNGNANTLAPWRGQSYNYLCARKFEPTEWKGLEAGKANMSKGVEDDKAPKKNKQDLHTVIRAVESKVTAPEEGTIDDGMQ